MKGDDEDAGVKAEAEVEAVAASAGLLVTDMSLSILAHSFEQ